MAKGRNCIFVLQLSSSATFLSLCRARRSFYTVLPGDHAYLSPSPRTPVVGLSGISPSGILGLVSSLLLLSCLHGPPHQTSDLTRPLQEKTELDPTVTHVVSNPSKHTPKALEAALTGRWIVSADWVRESMQATPSPPAKP